MHPSKQILLWILGIALLYVNYQLIPVFTPFMIAAILAYLGSPLVLILERHHFSKQAAVSMVFLLISAFIVLLLLVLVPLFVEQLLRFINKIPDQVHWVQSVLLPKIKKMMQLNIFTTASADSNGLTNSLKHSMSDLAGSLLNTLTQSSSKLINILVNVGLVPVLTFYMMRDGHLMREKFIALLPLRFKAKICEITEESNTMLGSFLRGQLSVMLSLALVYSIGLSVLGLEFGLLIGLIAGLVSFVPYLGFIIGALIASISAWFQFGDINHLLLVILVFGVGQILESFVFTPKFVGEKLGMHPIAVIFALMACGQLFGFFGLLLALPSCAILMVLLRHFFIWYKQSKIFLKI